jgi:hypothetical protein
MEQSRRRYLASIGMLSLAGCGSVQDTASDPDPFEDGEAATSETGRLRITDAAGQGQLDFVGLNEENSLDDEDHANGFRLDRGVLIREAPGEDSDGLLRLVLGRRVGLGVRKSDTLAEAEDGEGGSSEFVKNPVDSPAITLENDFDDGRLRYESEEGGGHSFLTADATTDDPTDQTQRLFITDPADSNQDTARVDAVNCDQVGMGTERVAFYGKQQNLRGGDGRAGVLFPEPSRGQLRLGLAEGTEVTVQPDGWTESLRVGRRVTLGNAGANRPAHLPPQDVREIDSPERGDVAYHDGSGDAGDGLAHYDGENWNVHDGGTQL